MQQSAKLMWGLMLIGTTQATCVEHYGSLTCGRGEVDAIHTSGHVVLQDTTVLGDVTVSGHVDAESAHLSSVHVQGAAKFTQCTIGQSCQIEGSLVAYNTHFQGVVDIYANQATLENVRTQNINMHSNGKAPTVLSISGNSYIQGDIHIIPSGATIKIGPQVHIVGSITGATIVKGEK